MSKFIIANNGEIVEIGTGEVQGIQPVDKIPLSTDFFTLKRYWDGMSSESLGNTPKVITLSRKEERLLSQLFPWRWLKYSTRMDYLKLLDKLNKHKLALNISIGMKLAWADPDSYYNSPEFQIARAQGLRLAWANPDSGFNTQEFRDEKSKHFKKLWANPIYKARRIVQFLISNSANARKGVENQTRYKNYPMYYKDPEATRKKQSRAQKKTAKARWQKRVILYGPSGVKNPELTNKRKREAWAWRKCALVSRMIFGGI